MKKYVVVVEGANIRFRERPGARSGLFTTRRVEAKAIAEAEKLAIDLVKEELASIGATCEAGDDPPVFSTDESYEVGSFDGHIVPGKGFSLYEM